MKAFFSRFFAPGPQASPPEPGLYHMQSSPDAEIPYRLHLRIEGDGSGILIVNAATVLHLNSSAAAHALELIRGASETKAAQSIASRYRVSFSRGLADQRALREQVLALATSRDLDPVAFLGMDRRQPHAAPPGAPYRIDIALTYAVDPDGKQDPLARRRVDRELSTDEWKRVLEKAWEACIPHVIFTGGEPTRREDLVELIRHAEALGQVTGVITEGRRLAQAEYLSALSQAGVDHFLVALPAEADTASLEGLKNAIASDVFTAVHLSMTASNAGTAQERLQALRDQGVQAVSLSAASDVPPHRLAEARRFAADLHLDLVWDLPAPYSATNPISLETEEAPSGAGVSWLYVEPDGDVLPSQGIDRVLGNVTRDAWPDIWRKSRT